MANSGIKNSSVSWSVRIYRGLFSFPVIVTALSASSAALIRTIFLPRIRTILSTEVSQALDHFHPLGFAKYIGLDLL